MDGETTEKLESLLKALSALSMPRSRAYIFREAMEILGQFPEEDAEINAFYERFAEYYDELPDDEPEVVTEKKEDEIDPEKDIDVPVAKLQGHQIDVPEEPEKVHVVTQVWNSQTRSFEVKDLGELMLVPTGCEECEFLSPYENTVSFRSALPRDKQVDANLHAAYQKMGISSRDWIREHTDEEFDNVLEDRRIADDIPVLNALQGKQDPGTGVAESSGLDGAGDNNGAPLPPGPGPGRGNTKAPGDNGAQAPAPKAG